MSKDRQDPIPFREPKGRGAELDKQKGAQQHAQGQHGPKARAHLLEQLRSGEAREAEGEAHHGGEQGQHRLFERREQRDEAERDSEKSRLDRDIRVHGHNRENFQVRGGSTSGRATPRNRINPGEPDAPTPGAPLPPPPQRVPGTGAS